MYRLKCRMVLLAGAMLLTMAAVAGAQSNAFSSSAQLNELAAGGAQTMAPRAAAAPRPSRYSTDLAVTFAPEYARIASQGCPCFWFKGLSADGSFNFFHGLGIAAELSQGLAGNVQPGVGAHKVTLVAGPRYTVNAGRGIGAGSRSRIFAEGLFGVSHAYSGVFPGTGGVSPSATSSEMQIGGGYDIGLPQGFGLRLIEADWVHSSFPNGAANVQNDLRIAAGLSHRFGGFSRR